MVPQHVVFGGKEGQLLALEQLRLESPRIDVLLGDRSEPKTIDRLVVPCCGAIFRCGHVHVVTKIMLDEEVHVQARHVKQLAHQARRQFGTVPQLVGHIDAIGCQKDAGRQQQPHHLVGGICMGLDLEEKEGHQPKNNRHIGIQHRIENPHPVLLHRCVIIQVHSTPASDEVQHGQDDKGINHSRIGPDSCRIKREVGRHWNRIGKEVLEVFHDQIGIFG